MTDHFKIRNRLLLPWCESEQQSTQDRACVLCPPQRETFPDVSQTLWRRYSRCVQNQNHTSHPFCTTSMCYVQHWFAVVCLCRVLCMGSSWSAQWDVSTWFAHPSVWSLSCLRVQEKPLMPTSCRSPVPSLGFAPLFYPAVPETFRSFQPLICSWTRSCFMVVTDEILLKLGIWQSHCFPNHTLA